MAKDKAEIDLEAMFGGDRPASKKKKNRSPWPGRVIVALLVLLAVAFTVMLAMTRLLPAKYLAFLVAALVLLILVVAALVWDYKKRSSFWTGTALAALAAFLLIGGLMAGRQMFATFNTVTRPNTQVTQVGVLVRAEDKAQTLNDLKTYDFGILSSLDRESVDPALAQIGEQTGVTITPQKFDGLTELIDALLQGRIGAVAINLAYLDILEEMEGYEDIGVRLREVSRVGVETETAASSDSDPAADGVFTVYISGIDSRNGMQARSRSDVNIIAVINTNTHQVLLVSTPRDFFVPLSISNGKLDKLTHAGIYGIEVSMDTLEMLYDFEMDYYFKVSFTGFEQIIDSLGGVTVYSEYSFSSVEGDHYREGENFLNGSQALAFARERMAFSAGDRQRGRNQMAVIKGVIDKLTSVEVLKN